MVDLDRQLATVSLSESIDGPMKLLRILSSSCSGTCWHQKVSLGITIEDAIEDASKDPFDARTQQVLRLLRLMLLDLDIILTGKLWNQIHLLLLCQSQSQQESNIFYIIRS